VAIDKEEKTYSLFLEAIVTQHTFFQIFAEKKRLSKEKNEEI
jgi:hypothetical protein